MSYPESPLGDTCAPSSWYETDNRKLESYLAMDVISQLPRSIQTQLRIEKFLPICTEDSGSSYV
jgi:hypothetical protein